ncbi:MAG: TonB-dependent receptor domain-containing protein [Saprospiraceae bacterium]
MKKLLLLTLLLCGFLFQATAQRPAGGGPPSGFGAQPSITGRISGTLLDSTTNKPVEFATVVLFDTRQKKQVDGTITDEQGEFKFPEVKLGTYELQLSFLGYSNKIVKDISLTPQKPDFTLDKILLSAEGVMLNEIQVTGQAAVVENQIDKLVYNAEKDVTSVGGDASNVLQKVPLLSVDAEGNVSLRGSSNVQILINGKPSTMFSSNPADALRTIPADQIKSVEVITAPTAKFDGEGSGGIINIITKKKGLEGFTGSVNGSVGNRQNRGGVNLTLTRGRFSVNLNGNGWYNPNRPSYGEFYRVDRINDVDRILDQDSEGDSEFYGPRAGMNINYDINAYNSITVSGGFRGFGRDQYNNTTAIFTDPSAGLNQVYTRSSTANSLRSGFDLNTDYKRTFKRPEQELTLGFQIDTDRSTAENEFDQTGNEESLRIRNFNENLGRNLETTAQIDYVQPLSKAIKLETGVKGVLRSIDSDFSYQNFDFTGNQFVEDASRSDIFYYDQNVYSGYLSLNTKLGKNYGMVIGSRYETTDITGDFSRAETAFSNSYNNFLPSFILSRNFKNMSSLRFSYNQRIRRPGLFFVNPYIQQEDPREYTQGNPELLPEITDQYELNYNTLIKGIVLNASLFYRYTSDIIESFLEVTPDGISVNTFRNIGENHSIGGSFFTSINIKEKLTIRAGANISSSNSRSVINGVDISRTFLVWNGNLNGTWTLPKGFKIEAFGFYNSPRASLQGTRASFSQISFGFLKEFNKQFNMGLQLVQPFARDLKFENELEGLNFTQRNFNAVAVRSIGVSFSYRFGKLDFRQPRTRGARNNDLKQGEDGEMGGGNRN